MLLVVCQLSRDVIGYEDSCEMSLVRYLTILPFSGRRVNKSKQFICCHSFGIDIMEQWFSLLILISFIEGLYHLCFTSSRRTKNEHRMSHS